MMLGTVILLLLALLILIYPLISRRDDAVLVADKVQAAENLALYRERVADLESMDFSDAEKAAMQLELDRELLASQNGDTSVNAADQAPSALRFGVAGGVFIALLVLTFALYRVWGAADEVRATELLMYASEAELTPAEYTELDQRLSAAIAQNPTVMEWTYLHARLLQRQGQYADAAAAYDELLRTLPDDRTEDRAALLALKAQMQFFARGQQADEDLYATVTEALALVPDQQQALGLAGIMAFELGYYRDAIDHWRGLWKDLPQGMESMALENGIRRAAERLEANDETVDLSWLARTGIQVTVDLAPAVRQTVQPSDIVFVLARAVEGPPLPLAVQRMTVADLPVTLVLDDSMAMAPGMNLSSADTVTVTARISLTGNPVAQPGDWQTQVADVPTQDSQPLSLIIDTLVP